MIQPPHYHNPLAIAMPPGFENARVRVIMTRENFADVMTVVAEMVRAGVPFYGPDNPAPPDLRDEPSRKQRRQSIRELVKRAERTGKTVTSITTPDGTTVHFGEAEPTDASNPWLADLRKAPKQ